VGGGVKGTGLGGGVYGTGWEPEGFAAGFGIGGGGVFLRAAVLEEDVEECSSVAPQLVHVSLE
jgi:hypothetical protein